MTDHPLEALEVRSRPLKRAQYEAFAFSLFEGDVLVRNESHADPSNHEYRVTVDDGIPTACECPADMNSAGACKHRLAVAIRPRILEAVERFRAAADGDGSTRQRHCNLTATEDARFLRVDSSPLGDDA